MLNLFQHPLKFTGIIGVILKQVQDDVPIRFRQTFKDATSQ